MVTSFFSMAKTAMSIQWFKVLDPMYPAEKPRVTTLKEATTRITAGKTFVEFLHKPKHLHFFIEADGIRDTATYDEFVAFCSRLSKQLGPYVIAGYSSDQELAEHAGVPHIEIPEVEKDTIETTPKTIGFESDDEMTPTDIDGEPAQFHGFRAVFPATMVSFDTFNKVMNCTPSKGWQYGLPAWVSKKTLFKDGKKFKPVMLHHLCTSVDMGGTIVKGEVTKDSDSPMDMLVTVMKPVKEISSEELIPLFQQLPVKGGVKSKAAKTQSDCKVKIEDLVVSKPDLTPTLNNSDEYLNDILERDYDLTDMDTLIHDLRGVYGFCTDTHYLKEKDMNGYPSIVAMSYDRLRQKLQGYKPFPRCHTISLFDIVSHFSCYFGYIGAGILKEERPRYINLWSGYAYNAIQTDDFSILQPMLKHVREVVCNGDEEKYQYIMKWFASIIQNVTVKLGTMPIIWGAQGSGKSIFVELMCALLGRGAMANCDDLDKVFGKFNGLIGQYLLICLNEPPEANEKFKYNGKIKSKLTQRMMVQERKGLDQVEVESWANYIMTTNNANPVYEETGNRRIIYFATNNSHCGDKKYFEDLMAPIQSAPQAPYNPDYMGILLYYMQTQVDISGFNPEELIRAISSRTTVSHNENLERQYNSLSALHRWIVDAYPNYWKDSELSSSEIVTLSNMGMSPAQIGKQLSSLCDVARKNVNGERARVYKLKPREQIPAFYAIIDYINQDE